MRFTVSKYFLIATAAVFSVLVASLSAQTPASVAVTLKITDTADSPLQNARVQITPNPESISKPLVTDNKGEVTFHLESGAYEVRVSRWGFHSLDRHINVQGPNAALLHLTLQLPFNGSGSPVVVAPLPLHTNSVPLHELIPEIPHAFLPATSGSDHQRPHHEGAKRERLDG